MSEERLPDDAKGLKYRLRGKGVNNGNRGKSWKFDGIQKVGDCERVSG
jgi:hypothetical protein